MNFEESDNGVSRGGRPPYYLADKGLKPSGVYVRLGVASVPASEEAIRDMVRQSDGLVYDKGRSLKQELTFQYATEFFEQCEVPLEPRHMRSLGLTDEDGLFTNAALLLSDQCEHSLKCAVFDGTNKLRFKSRKEFFGSVLKQMDDAYEYIDLLNNVRADFSRLSRVEARDYPPYALREALVNAIVHRDYSYSGSVIVNIFDDRVEFLSLGGLVKGLTIIDAMNGVSQSRNTVLAAIFYRLKLIESYGTGIGRILESYQDSPRSPEFVPGPASFMTILPNLHTSRQHDARDQDASPCVPDSSNGKRGIEDSPKARVIALLNQQGAVSRKDVERLLGTSSFPARKLLKELQRDGQIEPTGRGPAMKYVRRI